MRLKRAAPIAIAVVSLFAATESRARYVGNLNLFVGQKWLNQGHWAPADEQTQFGLMLAFGEERAPVHFSLDAFVAKAEASDVNPAVDSVVKSSSNTC